MSEFDRLVRKQGRKLGKLFVPMSIIADHPDEVMNAMSSVIVLDADYVFWKDGIEYVVFCNDFREVEEGSEPPYYDILITQKDGSTKLEFQERL